MQIRRLILLGLATLLSAGCGGTDRTASGDPAPALTSQAPQALRLLVVGGTSGIGLETVKLALDRGHQVTAMARRPERMTLTHPNLETVKGDVADSASVDTAVKDHDAVVFAIGIGPTRDPVTVFSEGTRNVLSSMSKHNVSRLVMITGIGAGDSRGHGGLFYDHLLQPMLLKTIYQDKDRSEALVKISNVSWVIVRPGFLNDAASEASYRVIHDMEGIKSGDISRADVAHFIVSALEAGSYNGATVLLTN